MSAREALRAIEEFVGLAVLRRAGSLPRDQWARMDQLDESIGSVEAQLHRRSLYEHMFAFKAKRRAALASGPSQSWLGVPSP